ncbi:MAG TPA: helix-turn-helix domain-containing protein [Phycisphaerae bacterium]|nr:helix-turn-helix domain-containing protein [Phycisphaerae bacterium]
MTGFRERLFEPGRYLSIPLTLASRADLTASAKLVWAALAAHLGPEGDAVWPSFSRLARMTGAGRRTVVRAVEELAGSDLIAIERTEGRRNRYRLRQPAAGLFEPPIEPADPCQSGTGANLAPVPDCPHTSASLAPVPVPFCPDTSANLAPEVLYGSTTTTPPPPPPAGKHRPRGGPCATGDVPAGRDANPSPPTQSSASGVAASGLTAEQILAVVDAAHREAFGGAGMPASWKRRIRREARQGDPAVLASVTAATIRTARRLAAEARRTFGWGWVLRAATDARGAATLARGRRSGRRADREAKAVAEAARDAKAAEAAEHWRTLGPAERERFMERGRAMPGGRRPELAEATAMALAWRARSEAAA